MFDGRAMGPCTALYNFIFATASCMFSVSTAVLIAANKAVGDDKATGRTIVTAASSSLTLGFILLAMVMSYPVQCLRLMGANSGELVSIGVPYLKWRASALPANMFLLVAGGAFRGVGDARANFQNGSVTLLGFHMYDFEELRGLIRLTIIVVVGFHSAVVGLINLVLDPLLIFSLHLNVAGAAIATAVAQWAGAFFYAIKMYRRRHEFGINSWDIIPTWGDVKVRSSPTKACGGALPTQLTDLFLWSTPRRDLSLQDRRCSSGHFVTWEHGRLWLLSPLGWE